MRIPFLHIIIPVAVFTIISTSCLLYSSSPQKQAEDKAWEEHYDKLQQKIVSMDCKSLQQIRLDSIQGKPFNDTYGQHWDSIRDTYNAKSCGNHWGWWED